MKKIIQPAQQQFINEENILDWKIILGDIQKVLGKDI